MERTIRPFHWGLAVLVAIAAACTQDTTSPGSVAGPEPQLSTAEAEFLAVSFDRVSDATTGDAFNVGMASGPPAGAGSGTWTFSFENTRECPEGGQVVASGSGDFTREPDTRSFEMTLNASKTIDECAFLRDDVLFTLNGNAELSVHVLRQDGQLVTAERHITGFLSVVTSDGRSWECSFELHAVFDGETRSVEVTGTLCERPIGTLWARG